MFATATLRRASWAFLAALAALSFLLIVSAPTHTSAQVARKSVTLTGAEENPPVTSTAAGQFLWELDGKVIVGEAIVDSTGKFTQGHIHLAAKGSNGPVIAFLFGPIDGGQQAVHSQVRITADKLVGPMKDKTLDDFLKEVNAGNTYVNYHSVVNPGGEIRAQLPAGAAPAASPVTAPRAPSAGSGLLGTSDAARSAGIVLLGIAIGGMVLLTVRRRHAA